MNIIKRGITLALASVMIASTVYAKKYTAFGTGSYFDASVWQGGVVAPASINNDTIIIAKGANIMLTADISVLGNDAMFMVNGIVNGPSNSINIFSAPLFGDGTISVDSLYLGPVLSGFSNQYSGEIYARKLHLTYGFGATAAIFESDVLYISDTIKVYQNILKIGSKVVVRNSGSTIAGPYLDVKKPGSIDFLQKYTVVYEGNMVMVDPELQSPMLDSMIINPPAVVYLRERLELDSTTLVLATGVFNLLHKDLVLNDKSDIVSTGGKIECIASSSLYLNIAPSQPLLFETGTSLGRLEINVDSGNTVTLGSDVEVTGVLDLKGGKLDLRDNVLRLPPNSRIFNASDTGYVVTSDGGAISADIGPPGTPFTFPIGTADHFAPCTITPKNNSFSDVRVNLTPEVKTMGTAGKVISGTQPLVNATWNVSSSTYPVDADVELRWTAGMEVNGFNRQKAYITLLEGALWNKYTPAAATALSKHYSINRQGIDRISSFAVFDENTVDIQDVETAGNIQLYPSPAHNVLHINTPHSGNAVIYNSAGQAVLTTKLTEELNTIDISSLPPGAYIIQTHNKYTIINEQFMKH